MSYPPRDANALDLFRQHYVEIAGERSPGKATIKGAGSPRGWDIRKGYALSGATVVPTGDELSEFSIVFEIWTADDLVAWQAYAKKYFDKSVRFLPGSTKPRALGIKHPALNSPPLNITAVVVKDATQFEDDEEGLLTCEVKLLEYRAPRPAPDKPSAVIPAAQQPQPTAEDAADREIQQKLDQLSKLVGP